MDISLNVLDPFPGLSHSFQVLGECPQGASALSAILTLLSKLQLEVLAGMFVSTVLLHLRSTERRDRASTSSFIGREKERMLSWEAGTK